MKNIKYILVPAIVGMMFTACNNEVKGPSQADLDAQVEAKVKAATDQLKADCDSRMMQAAQLKADSIMAKAAGKKVVSAPVAAPKPAAPKPAAPKPTTTTTKPKTTVPVKKTETQVVKDRFKTDTKKEVKDVKDRFDSKKPTEQKVKEEVQEVKSRFSK